MQAAKIIGELASQGFSFNLVAGGGLVVRPFSKLPDTQRELLRAHKADIVALLSREAVNDPASTQPPDLVQPPAPAPAKPAKPPKQTFMDWQDTWLHLDRAYQAHHFNCSTCKAAGLGYGLRCGTGAALWTSYSSASS